MKERYFVKFRKPVTFAWLVENGYVRFAEQLVKVKTLDGNVRKLSISHESDVSTMKIYGIQKITHYKEDKQEPYVRPTVRARIQTWPYGVSIIDELVSIDHNETNNRNNRNKEFIRWT